MLKSQAIEKIITIERYSLLLCIFSIPLFESPKIIFLVTSGAFFLMRRYMEKDYKNVFLTADPRLGFFALFMAAALSAMFAQKPQLAFDGSLDFLKMYLIFVIVATDFTDKRSLKSICLTIIFSTAIASIWGLAEYAAGKTGSVELNSVGHVNHSAIYIALALVVSIVISLNSFDNKSGKIWIFSLTSFLFAALIFSSARASILGAIAAIISMFIFTINKKRFVYIIVITAVPAILFVLSLVIFKDSLLNGHSLPVFQLLQKNMSIGDSSLSDRLKLWERACEIFIEHPIFGVGAKHFKFYNTSSYGSHAHSLYFNILGQLGIVGFSALASLIYFTVKSFKVYYRKNALWHAALGAFIIVAVNGIFNTTLHSEHGLLFALILGMIQGRETGIEK